MRGMQRKLAATKGGLRRGVGRVVEFKDVSLLKSNDDAKGRIQGAREFLTFGGAVCQTPLHHIHYEEMHSGECLSFSASARGRYAERE